MYWNSRLHTEHDRLVQLFNPEEGVVADVFAGVGPFAVPSAKRGCAVLANDLNPESVKWLRKNVEDNNVWREYMFLMRGINNLKVSRSVRVSCEDGRAFIKSSVRRLFEDPFPAYAGPRASKRKTREERRKLHGDKATEEKAGPEKPSEERNSIAHFVMNLPDTAIEFLDAFRGVFSHTERDLRGLYDRMPMVHCHCFTRFLEPDLAEADIRKVRTQLAGTACTLR